MRTRATLAVWLLVVPSLLAQPPAKRLPGDDVIEQFLREDTAAVSKRFLDGAKTLDEWKQRLPRLRQEYLDMLGLWPLPPRTPLKATVTGILTRDDVAIEKVHFQSKPGLYVTGNLYRPKDNKKKLPTILYVCGHSGRGRDGNKTAFQDHGMWFARNGYVCLVIDTLQLGEIAGKHHGTYNLGRWWWHSLGYTPAGVECWNGVRAIDYLVTRPDVDPEKIGVTGISGGGASTIWIAAADDRVKVAVPVSGMSDLESYVTNKVINGHCDCMFLVNLYGWEWTTIAAVIAPRPMLFANSDNDRIFPMDGNRRIIARLREVYKLYDKGELVDDFVSKGGHDYRPDLRLAIFKWINKHLKGDDGPIKDAEDGPLPGKELRVFAEDSDLPKDAINASIDETFIRRATLNLPEEKEFTRWKEARLTELRRGPFRTFPERPPEPRLIKSFASQDGKGKELYGWLVSTESPAQAFVSVAVRWPKADKLRTIVVLGEDEEARPVVPDWAKALVGDSEVRLVLPRGTERTRWTGTSPPNYVERAHALLGRTADQGRVYDICSLARWMEAHKPGGWRVMGKGQAGVLAAYAALFEPSITEVVVVDPPASHRDGPHFLGVQRLLDVPDALGLLAPRKLTLVGATDAAFDRTEKVYKIARADDKLTRLASVRSGIDPAGIPGKLVLASEASDAVLRRFVEVAGGKKACIAVVTPEGTEEKLAEKLKPAEVRLWKSGARPGGNDPTGVTGVWFNGPAVATAAETLLARGLVLGGAGKWSAPLARLLPDAEVEVRVAGEKVEKPLTNTLALAPDKVGYEIGPGAALVVQGRQLEVSGLGKVTIYHRGLGKPWRVIELSGTQKQDLTALRRAARDRTVGFPYDKARAPVVEKGTLVIVGGGAMPGSLFQRFVDLAGGKKAKLVVLPTAMPDPLPSREGIARAFRKAGVEKVTTLKGRTLAEVESKESLDALKEATGIWFDGGRQWRFIDAYEGTKAVPLMFDVLRRGGVIGGSSAGATIQGEYLCRGGVFHNFDIAYDGYERGLGFLPGVAIDQHFTQRNRFKDMSHLMKLYPQLLGIGIDEATALVVTGSVAEVVGRGKVHFYDRKKPVEQGKPDYESFGAGERYDLKERKVVAGGK